LSTPSAALPLTKLHMQSFLSTVFPCLCFALSAEEWKRRAIYQVITDRFALSEGQQHTCNDSACPYGAYCGGNFQGLADNLDYIVNMGFDAIWISPVIDNMPCGYHGYWARNITKIEEHFGGEEHLAHLINKAHEKGVAVMVDTAPNHMGPDPSVGDFKSYYPFNSPEHFHKPMGYDCQAPGVTQAQRELGWMGGGVLPDLNQDHAFVRSQLLVFLETLVHKFGIDGLRVDAVPYVNKTFLQELKLKLPRTFIIGEAVIPGSSLEYTASYQYTLPNTSPDANADGVQGQVLDGILNYPLWVCIRRTFGASSMPAHQLPLSAFAECWRNIQAAAHDVSAWGNYIDSHDVARWFRVSPDPVTYQNGFVAALFFPGIPISYYGAEQNIVGGGDPSYIDKVPPFPSEEARAPLWIHGYNQKSDLYQWTKRAVLSRATVLRELPDAQLDELQHIQARDGIFFSFQRGAAVIILSQMLREQSAIPGIVQTSHPQGTLLCDSLQGPELGEFCAVVGINGTILLPVDGRPRVLVPARSTPVQLSQLYFTQTLDLPQCVALGFFAVAFAIFKHVSKSRTQQVLTSEHRAPLLHVEGV